MTTTNQYEALNRLAHRQSWRDTRATGALGKGSARLWRAVPGVPPGLVRAHCRNQPSEAQVPCAALGHTSVSGRSRLAWGLVNPGVAPLNRRDTKSAETCNPGPLCSMSHAPCLIRHAPSSRPHAYGFFGEPIRATGPLAANPFGFSTKYQDAEIELLYYGYRYYSPTLGRWLSRDPMGELAGLHLYGFVGNNAATGLDVAGLASLEQLVRIMGLVLGVLERSLRCECPNEADYLECVLNELDTLYADAGFNQVVEEALSQVNRWKVDVRNATGLDPFYAQQLEQALNTLANAAGGMAERLNNIRRCFNKCVSRVTGPVSTALELYNGDAVVATMVLFEKATAAAVPLKPFEKWIGFYKKAYAKATRALDQIGLDGLEAVLKAIEDLDSTDCDEINTILGKGAAAPPKIRKKCISKLNSGVGL